MSDKLTILAVDDDPRNHAIVKQILGDLYTLAEAFDGQAGVEMAQALRPDIILMDIMMPVLDGYEASRIITSDPELSGTPVLFLSAKESLSERLTCYDVGGTDYLTKPFEHEELLAKIKKLADTAVARKQASIRVSEATTVAFQAMVSASELGAYLQFIESAFRASTFSGVADVLKAGLAQMQLRCAVIVFTDDNPIIFATDGEASPLETSIIMRSRDKGRLIDYKQRTLVNFSNVAVLIKNMPTGDDIKYGQIRDNICILLSSIDAKLDNLKDKQRIEQQTNVLTRLVSTTNQAMKKLNNSQSTTQGSIYGAIETVSSKMSLALMTMGLTEAQEDSINNILGTALTEIQTLYDASESTGWEFSELINYIDDGFSSGAIDMVYLGSLLDKLQQSVG